MQNLSGRWLYGSRLVFDYKAGSILARINLRFSDVGASVDEVVVLELTLPLETAMGPLRDNVFTCVHVMILPSISTSIRL